MKKTSQETCRFEFVIGVNAGYDLAQQKTVSLTDFGETYKSMAAEVMEETGVYPSGSAEPVRVLYHNDWGCPEGGEVAFKVTGTRNPLFSQEDAFKAAVEALVSKLAVHYDQSTVTLEWSTVDWVYFEKE